MDRDASKGVAQSCWSSGWQAGRQATSPRVTRSCLLEALSAIRAADTEAEAGQPALLSGQCGATGADGPA
jgi:hypothetical protein